MKYLYYFLSFYLLPFIFGCKQKSLLEIQDLKFVNIEKNAIVLNQIDTTYLISDFKLYGYGKTDTFGYNVYNKRGNLITEWRYGFMGPPMSTYLYDSNDLVVHKEYSTDYWLRFDVTYKFIPDSLLLYQYWSDGAPVSCFWFNEKGLLIRSKDNIHGGWASEIISTFEYDDGNNLVRKVEKPNYRRVEELELRKNYFERGISSYDITEYFYNGQKLDSVITKYYIEDNPQNNYTSKTYFNESGLRYKTILMDTIITTYLHKSRSF